MKASRKMRRQLTALESELKELNERLAKRWYTPKGSSFTKQAALIHRGVLEGSIATTESALKEILALEKTVSENEIIQEKLLVLETANATLQKDLKKCAPLIEQGYRSQTACENGLEKLFDVIYTMQQECLGNTPHLQPHS